MILINDTKYSCSECIRGHRSSLCRHHMRPLLQVRSKGRPNLLFPEGNKDYRIAVFAQEIEEEPDVKTKCKDTPVIILKTSEKHVINLNNGQIMGPYVANKDAASQRTVGPQDFVNSTSCCPSGSSRVKKGCECNKGKVSKKKILRSYLDKRLAAKEAQNARISQLKFTADNSMEPKFQEPSNFSQESVSEGVPKSECPSQNQAKGGCCSSKSGPEIKSSHPFPQSSLNIGNQNLPAFLDPALDIPTLNCGILKQDHQSPLLDANLENGYQEFHAIAVPSCSIPGTCSCSSDCSCPSCVVHQSPKKALPYSLEMLNNDSQYGSNLILTSGTQSKNSDPVSRDIDSYTSYLSRIIGYNVNEPSQGDPDNEGSDSTASPVQQLKCSCAKNSCLCSNCETHGIINGYRLDDIFGTHDLQG